MIYDIFDCKVRPEKGRPRSNIYTGTGAQYSVLEGACEELIKGQAANSIHAIVCDPPFGVNINKDWDSLLPTKEVWAECYRVLKPGGYLLFFGQPSMMANTFDIMSKTDFDFRDIIIWCYQGTHPKGFKTDDEAFRSRIRNVYNPVFVYRKKLEGTEEQNWKNYRTNLFNINDTRMVYKGDHTSIIKKFEDTGKKHVQSDIKSNTFGGMKQKGWVPDARGSIATNVIYCPRPTRDERTINGKIENEHETLKPVSLMCFLIKLVTNSPEQVVLDIYCGSGSTGMACRKNNRAFIGYDKDPHWVDVAKFRIKNVFDLEEKHFNKTKSV
jgi:site-specific DNA-methyltransferase (adenine-specific)